MPTDTDGEKYISCRSVDPSEDCLSLSIRSQNLYELLSDNMSAGLDPNLGRVAPDSRQVDFYQTESRFSLEGFHSAQVSTTRFRLFPDLYLNSYTTDEVAFYECIFRLTQLRLWQWLLLAQNIRSYADCHDTAWL